MPGPAVPLAVAGVIALIALAGGGSKKKVTPKPTPTPAPAPKPKPTPDPGPTGPTTKDLENAEFEGGNKGYDDGYKAGKANDPFSPNPLPPTTWSSKEREVYSIAYNNSYSLGYTQGKAEYDEAAKKYYTTAADAEKRGFNEGYQDGYEAGINGGPHNPNPHPPSSYSSEYRAIYQSAYMMNYSKGYDVGRSKYSSWI